MVGGVMSGIGKGVALASIGKILQEYGYKINIIKIDPYVNIDAGTMRPTEHGEVWVTEDGGETDQDLGNYERFLGVELSKKNNITTGQIFQEVIKKERCGEYLGKTVQIIPHVIDEIERRIMQVSNNCDIMLIEIGGTVGDYENMLYLFATKRLETKFGQDNVIHILISYLPIPEHIGEPKTKPTQQAIRKLNEMGITPKIILCRSKKSLDDVRRKKIETYANIPSDYVISAPDIDSSVYGITLNFEKEKLGEKLLKLLNLEKLKNPDWRVWKTHVKNLQLPHYSVNIGIVGKYIDIGSFSLADAYISINEALKHAGAYLNCGVNIIWIDSKKIESGNYDDLFKCNGIIVPGGFGKTGVEGKIKAIEYARTHNVPFLGLCYGMQLAVVEFARNVCNMKDAHTTEVDPYTKHPVIDILEEQKTYLKKHLYGATMRLGAYAAILKEGSKVYELYKSIGRIENDMKLKYEKVRLGIIKKGEKYVLERHRHRYEVNPKYVKILERNGLLFSGFHRTLNHTCLMEFLELSDHCFFIATQSHPEFKSKFTKPAPLFFGLINACIKRFIL